MFQQLFAPSGADAGDVFEGGLHAGLATFGAVPGDGETVRFVAHLLDEMETGMVLGKPEFTAVGKNQGFESGLARFTLGNAKQQHVGETEFGHGFDRAGNLPLSAVDQEQVGQHAVLLDALVEALGECGAHRGVVVAGGDAGDVVAAVVGFFQVVAFVDDVRRDGGFAHRVRDVETFDAFQRRQVERVGQRGKPLRLVGAFAAAAFGREPGIGLGHGEPDAALGGDAVVHTDFLLCQVGQQCFQHVGVEGLADEQARRHRVAGIMLGDKGLQRLGRRGPFAVLGIETAVAEVASAPDHGEVDCNHAACFGHSHHVGVGLATGGVDELLFAHCR